MAHSKSIAFALVTTASLAAAPAAAQFRSSINPSLNSVNQPVVQRTDYVIDLAAGGGVPDAELYRLANWFDSLELGYGDRVSVDGGGMTDPRAREAIANVAAEYGLLLSRGAPITAGAVQPGSVRVIVSRSTASVPGCPNWQDAGDLGGRSTTGTNYGCAVNSNLAAMVADPNDLVLGQSGAASGDASTASKAIKLYRDTPPSGSKGLQETLTRGGK